MQYPIIGTICSSALQRIPTFIFALGKLKRLNFSKSKPFGIWCTRKNKPNGGWEILLSLAVTLIFKAGISIHDKGRLEQNQIIVLRKITYRIYGKL